MNPVRRARERAKELMDRAGGGHPDLRPGFAAVTIESLTEAIEAAQIDAENRAIERCRIVARDHTCDPRCKDEGSGSMCDMTIMQDIGALLSEYGDES